MTEGEELQLLRTRTGRVRMRAHLGRLIDLVGEKMGVPPGVLRRVRPQLLQDMSRLADEYLSSSRPYKFSAWFDWHIRSRLRRELREERT